MKFLNFNKVLCLSPHPDDVEYSMSATINKYHNTKFDIVCLSHGTATDTTSNSHRLSEVEHFWKLFKCDNATLIHTDIKYFESMSIAQWVTFLDKIIDSGYDAICTTSALDSHQEHIFLNSLIAPLTRSKPISVIEYKSPSTLHTWIPNYFVSCETQFKLKCNTLRESFISQLDSIYFNEDCIRLFHNDYNCTKRGIIFTEQFKIVTLYNY
jgi:LmbE family N-acetylglucosaminyl deacetylase